MKRLIVFLGTVISYVFPLNLYISVKGIYKYLYTGFLKRFFSSFGDNSVINPSFLMLVGPRNIHIGKNVYIGSRVQLTAWKNVGTQLFDPIIILGDNVSIGDDSHITSINKIVIGNGVLTGKKVLITDNAHGQFSDTDLKLKPLERKMYSKGPVVINDNVWIGEKASILAGVTIGKGSVVAANSVVTKDVPNFSLVAGCPAKVIKYLKNDLEK